MITVHDLPYWKAIRERNFKQQLHEKLTEIATWCPQDMQAVSDGIKFLLWSNGHYIGSPMPVLRGFLEVARTQPEALARMVWKDIKRYLARRSDALLMAARGAFVLAGIRLLDLRKAIAQSFSARKGTLHGENPRTN